MIFQTAQKFRYKSNYTMFFLSLFFLIWIMFVGAVAIIDNRGNAAFGCFFVLIVTPFVAGITLNALLTGSDLIFDPEGIDRSIFGIIWKRIRWINVTKIRVMSAP